MRSILSAVVAMLFILSCQSGKNQTNGGVTSDGIHKVVVLEVLPAGTYTYLRVKESDAELWLAVSAMQAEIGATYYFKEGLEMKNFHSKELNRDFTTLYLINDISTDPEMKSSNQPVSPHGSNMGMNMQGGAMGNKPVMEKQDAKVSRANGGITIAELYSKKDTYSGKSVIIKAKVAKFSPDIMSRNWIHLQDGTEHNGDFDLTVTSDAIVKIGDVITIEGKVALDKDFGAGYFYKVIVEDAMIK